MSERTCGFESHGNHQNPYNMRVLFCVMFSVWAISVALLRPDILKYYLLATPADRTQLEREYNIWKIINRGAVFIMVISLIIDSIMHHECGC